jgi:hypothetical protein
MDSFITLLTNLFNLSKLASVTLPGLALAGVVALFFREPRPVDVVPLAVVEFQAPGLDQPQKPCSAEPTLGNGNSQQNCMPNLNVGPRENASWAPVCRPVSFDLGLFDELAGGGKQVSNITPKIPSDFKGEPLISKDEIEQNEKNPRVLKQRMLEAAKDSLTACMEVEKSWKGQEEENNKQLTADITGIDKQRSDMQDTYVAYLKSNNRVLAENYRTRLAGVEEHIDELRRRYNTNLVSINERERRLSELQRDSDIIKDRLGEPDRLRPIKGFDIYVQGLLNHIVGVILLAMALSLILNAFDRATFGAMFEGLFDGF